jgi:predicted amidohydrolase
MSKVAEHLCDLTTVCPAQAFGLYTTRQRTFAWTDIMMIEDGFVRVKVAAISLKPQRWKKEANAVKMEKMFRMAARRGAQVALITEGALEGYVVMDAIKKPAVAPRVLDIAERVDGPYIRRFTELAMELKMCLCFGFAERVGEEVYNTAVFIDHEGKLRGLSHKMQFAEGYHDSWFFNRLGVKAESFDTPYGRAGFLICNDRWNPTLARALVLDGARVIYIPAYGSTRLRQDSAVLARARENGVPIVEANVGLNLIVSKGEVVARERGVDKITMAEIDIPVEPSRAAARRVEAEFLGRRDTEMAKAYTETMAEIRKARPSSRRASSGRAGI